MILLAIALIMFLDGAAKASVSDAPRIPADAELRGSTTAGESIHGNFVRFRDGALVYRVDTTTFLASTLHTNEQAIALSRVDRLEYLASRRDMSAPMVFVGVVAGIAAGLATNDGFVSVPLVAVAGGVVGAIGGGILGSFMKFDDWKPVALPTR